MKSEINGFEDVTLNPYWFWEIRAISEMPDDVKKQVKINRKKRKQVFFIYNYNNLKYIIKIQERIQAISDYLNLKEEFEDEARLKGKGFRNRSLRAYEKLNKSLKMKYIIEENEAPETQKIIKIVHYFSKLCF